MRVGVLTGGGDAAGLNAAIRAVTVRGSRQGFSVAGIIDGWAGLLPGGTCRPLHPEDVADGLHAGGTMLGSSRTNPLILEGGIELVTTSLGQLGIDGLVAIGGDDTLSVASALAAKSVPVVGIPKTIDFDLDVTDYCIGFESAVAVIAEALDRLATTGASHHRTMVLEVMGRDTGWLAIMGGLAGGADLVALPEFPLSLREITDHAETRRAHGASSSLIVVAEGAHIDGLDAEVASGEVDSFGHAPLRRRAIGERLADAIGEATGIDTRATVLGHVQRGGTPVASDRIWPTRLGIAAIDALTSGRSGVCAAVVGAQPTEVPLAEVVAEQKRVPWELYESYRSIS